MSKHGTFKRYLIFLVGIFITDFGISFVTKAGLGTSPISSIPYTLSFGFQPTIGMFTLYMSAVLIIIQLLLLKKDFPKQYFLQIPASIAFSWFMDLTMNLLTFLTPSAYWEKLISLLIGCILLAIGVNTQMMANVVLLPGEAFVKAISITLHTDFGKTKVAIDTLFTLIAGLIGLVLFNRIAGIGEGTLIAALLVGTIVRFLKSKFTLIENFFFASDSCSKDSVIVR